MSSLVPDKRHPALDADMNERIDYLTLVASMAFADHSADDRELERARAMCEALELSEEGTVQVLASAGDAGRVELNEILERLKRSELRYALMIDIIDIAYADEEVVEAEVKEIKSLADKLDISAGDIEMLRRYVEKGRKLTDGKNELSDAQIAAGLAGTGVPVAAVALATTLGAPVIASVGMAAALGVGSYMSVRWLWRRGTKDEGEASPDEE
jgi:uncharacterized tellurite resistance protein B-like protein